MSDVTILAPSGQSVAIGSKRPLAFILGPCVIESRDHALKTASFLAEIGARRGIPLVYKSSFDKANRTSGSSFRGIRSMRRCRSSRRSSARQDCR